MHQLWKTQKWEQAKEEEVIAALFNPPAHLDPFDMAEINRHHPNAKPKYLNLFYSGNIPNSVKRINKI